MRRLLPVLALAATALGCAGPAPYTLGPTALFRADVSGATSAPLERLDAVRVPENAELRLATQWFVGKLRARAPGRLEVVVRVRRVDGSTIAWRLGGDTAQDGARGVTRGREDGRYREMLGVEETDPVRAAEVVALEVLVSRLDPVPASPAEGAVIRGGRRVAVAPTAGAERDAMRAAELAVHSGGGELELALLVPVLRTPAASPGETVQWLVAVEAEPDPIVGPTLRDVQRLETVRRLHPTAIDGDVPVAARTGEAVARTSALAIAVRAQVVDHALRPAPGEPQEKERRRRDPHDLRFLRILRDLASARLL